MSAAQVELVVSEYLRLHGGNVEAALCAAVADLLQVRNEVAVSAAALDQWTSRGYVQRRASEQLARLLSAGSKSRARHSK